MAIRDALKQLFKSMNGIEPSSTKIEDIIREGSSKMSSGGGGVQPDWDQNDPNAPDYVKNRPFYTNFSLYSDIYTLVETL